MQLDLVIRDPAESLQKLLQAMRRRLTFHENIQCQILEIADSGPALTPQVVQHNLGKVPTGYIANLNKHGTIRSVNQDDWTETEMQLESSVANARVSLIVF